MRTTAGTSERHQERVLTIHTHAPRQELVDRYNPTHDMTQDERVKATANRVGLNTPLEYDPAAPRPIPSGEKDGVNGGSEDGKGSLQTMFAPDR